MAHGHQELPRASGARRQSDLTGEAETLGWNGGWSRYARDADLPRREHRASSSGCPQCSATRRRVGLSLGPSSQTYGMVALGSGSLTTCAYAPP